MDSCEKRAGGAEPCPEISVVVPLYNEQELLRELYRRLTLALSEVARDGYELVFVDDGSRDDTPGMIDTLCAQDNHVVGVHLSRNFGHQPAISAGIDQARGSAVIIMDGDLQDPPEVLGDFIELWRKGHDVVYAIRTKRKEGVLKRFGYFCFYRLLRLISDLDIPLDSGDFCLMDRKVVEVLKQLPERMRFVRGLRTFVGFRQVGLAYERAEREAGKPKYSFKALARLAVDGLISFSSYPLHLVAYLGFLTILVAVVIALWVLYEAIDRKSLPAGWASVMVIVLVLGAIQLISLGIMGEYIRRIFIESKGRPTYIIGSIRRDDGSGPITPRSSNATADGTETRSLNGPNGSEHGNADVRSRASADGVE